MKHFPEGIQFCYAWRSYQQRVLDELDVHLANGHLHLVAPPGSGKAEFLYTRTVEGRQQLLEARMKALSASFVPKAERLSGWR